MATRKVSLLIVSVLLCSFPALAYAELEQPWSRVDCAKRELLTNYPLPAELSKETVLRDLLERPLITSETQHEYACNIFGKQWKLQKQATFVVFLETALWEKARYDGME